MNCIIVDDEPLAREAIQLLASKTPNLQLLNSFGSANAAAKFINESPVDLIFLDIQMPGISGMEFAKIIPSKTLLIFTTAYAEYALEGFEVEAIDYLIKPIRHERFLKAVNRAQFYQDILKADHSNNKIENIAEDYFFVKADRKYIKIYFKDILFIEGLKDYVVMQTDDQKVITAMNIKTIHEQLPQNLFARISKSYIININQITAFDNNTVNIRKYELSIGNAYRTYFFDEFVTKKILSR
ncbi:response regulator transcription factor [Mucilaginibacter sp. HC2]|uniref:LytR/AlgR family response regulator transcription factor n=1 Tax=Mucilaginibacter inviolabilis TaxID=2714892 RepID=UPI00140DA46C|nr:LytTR family DNA-binding domain-containing protein [Mucilaginibacter inviolabilis]NHA04759.1 response regulator transcription factor [Mucilaginibacter inviolabilis]